MLNRNVHVLIIVGFGLNCERETALAFEQVGARPELVHLNDLISGKRRLSEFHVLALIGGFSFGDHLGAGTAFANRLRYRLRKDLEAFIRAGRLIIGICNGFQIMTRLGLVPALNGDLFTPQVGLAPNRQGVFRDAWVMLRVEQDSPCVWTKGLEYIELPVRHGEGRFVTHSGSVLQELESRRLVVLRYVDPETLLPTDQFPHNPNGSWNAIAGICDPTGRLFGLMPHPEAYLLPYHHPRWRRLLYEGRLPAAAPALEIFRNGVEFAKANLL